MLTDLCVEYDRWSTTREIVGTLNEPAKQEDYGEALNILERWLLSGSNYQAAKMAEGESGLDPVYAMNISSCPHTLKMIEEIPEKGLSYMFNIDKIIGIVNTYLESRSRPCELTGLPDIDGITGKCSYYGFSTELSVERIQVLRYWAKLHGAADNKEADIHICRMLLRYKAIISRNQHLNAPVGLYSTLNDWLSIDVEGFASPINSQLLRIGYRKKMAAKTCQFCSLFPDTDAIFGSIGSFFDNNFAGKTVSVHAPYVLDIQNAALKHVVDQCAKAEAGGYSVAFDVGVAAWTDAEYHEVAESTKYLKALCVFGGTDKARSTKYARYPSKPAWFENSGERDKPVYATFASTWFYIAHFTQGSKPAAPNGGDYGFWAEIWPPMPNILVNNQRRTRYGQRK